MSEQHRPSRASRLASAADKMLDSSILRKLTFDRAGESEQDRRHDRTNVYARVTIIELDMAGQEGRSWTASVLDASRGGLGLFSPLEATAEQLLLLILPAKDADQEPTQRLVRVAHCRQEGETGFVIGVRFEAQSVKDRAA